MSRIDTFNFYYNRFGINGVLSVIKAKIRNTNVLKIVRQGIKFPFYLRDLTTDISTFDQVFINKEYDFVMRKAPSVIVDAGANIGLSSIYFANKYPESKIIAIEPEKGNYEMLKNNVAPYDNIVTHNAALWNANEEINLIDPGRGNWAFLTEGDGDPYQAEHSGKMCHKIQGMTINKIMEKNGIEKIDVLKIDIEGAEREVFKNSSSWIGKVDALIIELHERLKPGCNSSVYNGTKGFDDEWKQGENVFFSRRKCLTPNPDKPDNESVRKYN